MRPAPRLTLTPTELAAVVRWLGWGRPLTACLRRIEAQRAAWTEVQLELERLFAPKDC